MRDTVAPRLQRVAAALWSLDGAANPVVIEKHATIITGTMLHLLASYHAGGFEIECGSDGYNVRPKTKRLGLRRELEDFVPKCRKACAGKISAQEWTRIVAAQPDRVQALFWPSLLIEATEDGRRVRTVDPDALAMGFETGGFAMVAPKPDRVLPLIERALAEITAAPRSKARAPNPDEAAAIDAVRAAYREIIRHDGKRVIGRLGVLSGRLARLGRSIDAIFGTRLFLVADSKRLRR